MKATLILADHTRVSEGKLDVLGGGWTLAGPDPVTMGIGVLIEVPWDQTNRRHSMVVRLLGEDGQLYPMPGPDGGPSRGIEAHTEFEVGRPPGIAAGTAQPFALGLNLAQVPLAPGRRYEWRLEIDGESQDDWRVTFQTRSDRPPSGSATSW
jgi:hypothetical protein